MTSAADEEVCRILVVDDHPLLRAGLVRLIEETPGLALFGEAQDPGDTILAADSDPPPDLILLDLMLGHADGLDLIRQLQLIRPGLPILVLSMHDELIYAERALRIGASGFLMKKEPPAEVLNAIETLRRGEIFLSGRMKVLLEEKGLGVEASALIFPEAKAPLSNRELQVFRLIGAGLPTRQIAAELRLSIKTIETYREHLKKKLGVPNATALVETARRWVADNG